MSTRRFLWAAAAGVMFAVLCVMAAIKDLADRLLRRGDYASEGKQSSEDGC